LWELFHAEKLAPIFQHGTVPISTSAAAEGKEKAKKLAKKAEPQPYGNNLLNYFNPPLGKRPFDQENSPPNSPLKKSKAEPAASDKQQHETSAIGKNINFIDMGDEAEFIDLTGWQCPSLNCHDMNTSMTDICKRCNRHTSRANLKLFEAFKREDR
jgi:hypothetical protein